VTEADHETAARAVYDLVAERYVQFVGTEVSPTTEDPVDRSLLLAFVDLVTDGTVADVGCGPGRVAALLAARGLSVVGVDPSGAMIDVARAAHPHIEFREGRLHALPIGDHTLAGAVCWYSIIHTPPDQLDGAFVELGRVLMPRGYLLLAFQAGKGEPEYRAEAYGTHLSLTSYRHGLDEVTGHLEEAGFQLYATVLREPRLEHETTPQAFVLARTQ
jgi:ubiquinone/menaquinone biosynthesis C-methylase UbiE